MDAEAAVATAAGADATTAGIAAVTAVAVDEDATTGAIAGINPSQ